MAQKQQIEKNNMPVLKDVHITANEVSNILKEGGFPKFITYPIWYMIMFVLFISKKIQTLNLSNKHIQKKKNISSM